MLWCAWRFGGSDPFRLFNGLDDAYRPLDTGRGDSPRRPAHPSRVRSFMYAAALVAAERHGDELKVLAGGQIARRTFG